MNDKILVKCPKCKEEFSIDDVLVEQMESKIKIDLEKELKGKAKEEFDQEIKLLREEVENKDKKLSEFREQELKLRREKSHRWHKLQMEIWPCFWSTCFQI